MNHKDYREYKPTQKPTQKQAHLQTAQCQSTSQSLQKSLLYQRALSIGINRKTTDRKKGEALTMAIRNAGESADMKAITLNQLFGKRTVNCLEIPHYA